MRAAAVDVGTNTVRVLVIDTAEGDLDRDNCITRLGEGVDETKLLGPQPMRRTLEAIRTFCDRARALGADHVRIAGTSALRDARNQEDFARMVASECGVPLEILHGRTEGRLAYEGATRDLPSGAYVVCDIGGGSTELIMRTDVVSVDVGSVRVRERYLKEDPPTPDEVAQARAAVGSVIAGARAALPLEGGEELVGVAGTITTIAALAAGLEQYDQSVVHGLRLSTRDVREWSERLNSMPAAEIRALGPVAPGRADVIGAGSLVLAAVVAALGVGDLIVSERDILDGLVREVVG